MTCISDVLRELCLLDPSLLNSKGEINHNEAARRIGMNQPTFTRLLNGESRTARPETIEKLARFLRVTPAQMRGEVPLPNAGGVSDLTADYENYDDPLAAEIKDLSPEERLGVQAYIDALKARRAPRGS